MIATSAQLESTREVHARKPARVASCEHTRSANGSSADEVRTRVATNRADVHQALGLVYRAYRAANLIDANPFALRATKYHLLHTTQIFVAHKLDELAGTLTLVRDGLCGLPMEDLYGYEVSARRAHGRRLAEVSCLADASYGKSNMLSVVLKMMSHMAQFARHHGVDDLLIAVHPHHVGFYQRFIGFEVIGEQASYSAVCDHPAVPLALDLKRMPIDHPKAYERFFGQPFAARELECRVPDKTVVEELRQIIRVSPTITPVKRSLAAVA